MAGGGPDRAPYGDALALGSWAWENRSLIGGRITLAGGDPASLTLANFLDAGYALLLEEYRTAGMSLHEAIDQTAHLRAGGSKEKESRESQVPSEEQLVRQNQASMRELQQLMGGLGT